MALKNFTSDGCTNVPDEKFKHCCVEHDAYYHDGSVSRLEADNKLFKCILRKGDWFIISSIYYLAIASIYWGAVRIFGGSYYKGKDK